MHVLKTYEEFSGQVVNKRKSSIFFSKSISTACCRMLLQISGFSKGNFPFVYLGVPIVSRRLNTAHFDDLINKIHDRMEWWQARFLSSGDRLLLIRHVLQSVLIHNLSILPTLKVVINKIQRLISNFFGVLLMGNPRGNGVLGRLCANMS